MRVAVLLFSIPFSAPAVEYSARVVDGLGRPLAGALVEISCAVSPDRRKILLLQLHSDQRGIVHGTYRKVSTDCEKSRSARYHKAGYQEIGSGLRSEYQLKRIVHVEEIHRIAHLEGVIQQQALREFLAGEIEHHEEPFQNLVFRYEARFRFTLRFLARDPGVGMMAREMLAFIGASKDLHFILQLPSPPKSEYELPDRWRYGVATALVDPDSEDEWTFLRRCAVNEFDDGWVDYGPSWHCN